VLAARARVQLSLAQGCKLVRARQAMGSRAELQHQQLTAAENSIMAH